MELKKEHGHSHLRLLGIAIPQRYVIVFLTFLCTNVCYIERVGFSLAYTSTAIKVGVDQATKGWVLSAFYYGYASSQVPGGWAAQRLGGRRVLTLSFILWTITCVLTPTEPGPIFGLVVARLLVGVAQGFIFPSIHTVLAQWIPPHERSRSVSLTTSGMYFGAALAMLALPSLVASRGPASVFLLVAAIGGAWTAVWIRYATDPPGGATAYPVQVTQLQPRTNQPASASPRSEISIIPPVPGAAIVSRGAGANAKDSDAEQGEEDDDLDTPSKGPKTGLPRRLVPGGGPGLATSAGGGIPWMRIMLSWPVWAIVVNNFTFHYALYVLMNWLPTYFDQGLHASLHSLGPSKMLPYLVMFLFSNIGGVIADHLITTRTLSITATRKVLNTVGFMAAAIALLVMPSLRSPTGALACASVALGACALARAGFAVNHMDIAPRYAGIVMGVSNTAGTIAGVVGVAATGLILEAATEGSSDLEGWKLVFATPAVLCVISAVFFCVFATGERIFE